MTPCILSPLATGTLFASSGIEAIVVCAMVFSPGFVLVGCFVALMVYRKRQLSMQRAFISTLAVAAERKMPLASTIRACAAERGAWPRRHILLLAEMIESGVPPAEAFGRSQGLFPAEAIPVIQAGFQTESLGKALRQCIADDNTDPNLWASLTAKFLWLTLLLIYGTGILVFYMAKIVPALQHIFVDFETPLPPITQAVINVSGMVDLFFPLGFLFATLLLALSLYSLLRYSGWLTINLPGVDRLLRRYDMATVLETLALAVDRRQPLGPVLATFARFYPKRGIRQRLALVCVDVQQGGDWCGSLTRHKLIKPADEAVLQSAVRAGNLNWALRQLAGSQRRRFAYRLQMLSQAVFPPVVILVAIVVAIFVAGCFLPLVYLIQSLA